MRILVLVTLVLILVTELKGNRTINGKRLRVTVAEYPVVAEGFKFSPEGELIEMEGMGVTYLYWLAERYNYEYTITKYYRRINESFPIGAFKNGSWDGMMGDLTQDVADFAIGAFGARYTYVPYVELTFPWIRTYFFLYIPYPEENISIWSFLKPFTFPVWALLILSFVVVAFVVRILQNTAASSASEGKRVTFSYGAILLYLLAVMSGQGGGWNFKGRAIITLGATWCLTSVVIVNGYNGLLISYLTTTRHEPLVNSLEDLAANPSIEFYSYQNSYVIFTFTAATMGAKKVLGQVLLEKPERILPKDKVCLQVVGEGRGVCFMNLSRATSYYVLINATNRCRKCRVNLGEFKTGKHGRRQVHSGKLKETGKCMVTRVAKRFLEFNPVFLLKKGSPFFRNITTGMTWAAAMGFLPHWQAKYLPIVPECQLNRAKSSKAEKLMLNNFYGPFVMLFVGYFMATVVFIGERFAFQRPLRKNLVFTTSKM